MRAVGRQVPVGVVAERLAGLAGGGVLIQLVGDVTGGRAGADRRRSSVSDRVVGVVAVEGVDGLRGRADGRAEVAVGRGQLVAVVVAPLVEVTGVEGRAGIDDARPPAAGVVDVGVLRARRRADTLPLRTETTALLKEEFSVRTDEAPAFHLPSEHSMADMLRADLADAGIEPKDDAGRIVDFHALRHTFITNLARGGVHPKLAQDLARHSDINLTLSRYSHTVIGEQATALKALPDLSSSKQAAKRRTGTDDRLIAETALPMKTNESVLALFGGRGEISVDSGGLKNANGVRVATPLESEGIVERAAVCKAALTRSARSSAG
ncbi:MAG: tyrosine-type recombinase/integrase [Phycisphaerae bacterium]